MEMACILRVEYSSLASVPIPVTDMGEFVNILLYFLITSKANMLFIALYWLLKEKLNWACL